MIVATKEMKIESGYCPDLSMHVGEVNKQYLLVPPIDISGYSVRSEIVKPDHTFVYTDQAINADGNILFTLPEQAGAVAGYGYYIIKIYDLNTVVYSAVGNLIIDDHLIMDGMIESVAEVNGYTFPDDFMIRGDQIFDDTTVSNETGWSSDKISTEMAAIVNPQYTSAEKVVGTWIDGKPIYEQILHINSGWQSTMIIPVTNIKHLFSYWGFGLYGNYTIALSNIYTDLNNRFIVYGRLGEGIQISTGSVFYGYYNDVYLVIRYTKTTD